MSLALNIEDFRRIARARLPKGIFDYIDRGAEDEVGLKALREGFDRTTFNPRVLVDVSRRDLSVTLLGRRQPLPLVVAPTAAAGLVWHQGEVALARAAGEAGIPFCIPTGSITAMERIAAESRGPLWFQLYMWHDRALSYQLIDRAKATGIDTLVLTVDTMALPNREYNARNGFEVPIRASLRGGLDMLRHPGWVWNVLWRYIREEGIPTYQHYPASFRSKITRKATSDAVRLADNLTWEDFASLRRYWPGKLVLKGVLHPDDAARARNHGADAIVVTSHGARNLDSAVAPIDALPAIAETVGGSLEIIADSGVRRGSDVLKLLALGARAAMVGRSVLYGTAAGGEAGARQVLDLLRNELDTHLALLGCPSLAGLNAGLVNRKHHA
ncbi:alpha-hydroxy acid oxidase [Aliidongia dinghuensis]|nr:alpha-hydroxy acid oxidase [Aliidongia dinghuensis]